MVGAWSLSGAAETAVPKTYENQTKNQQSVTWWQQLRQLLKRPDDRQTTGARSAVTATPQIHAFAPKLPPLTTATTPQELTLTAVSLGLATTGALIFPATQIVCLPLLLYLGVTPLRTVYAALREQEEAPLALAETVILAICLLRQAYLAGALSYGCYVVAKAWLQQSAAPSLPAEAWQPPTWAWVQPDAVEHPKAVADLRSGERVIVHTGEMVPVAGVVTDGVAWVKCRGAGGVKVEAGSQVEAMSIVQVGCIGLTVHSTP